MYEMIEIAETCYGLVKAVYDKMTMVQANQVTYKTLQRRVSNAGSVLHLLKKMQTSGENSTALNDLQSCINEYHMIADKYQRKWSWLRHAVAASHYQHCFNELNEQLVEAMVEVLLNLDLAKMANREYHTHRLPAPRL